MDPLGLPDPTSDIPFGEILRERQGWWQKLFDKYSKNGDGSEPLDEVEDDDEEGSLVVSDEEDWDFNSDIGNEIDDVNSKKSHKWENKAFKKCLKEQNSKFDVESILSIQEEEETLGEPVEDIEEEENDEEDEEEEEQEEVGQEEDEIGQEEDEIGQEEDKIGQEEDKIGQEEDKIGQEEDEVRQDEERERRDADTSGDEDDFWDKIFKEKKLSKEEKKKKKVNSNNNDNLLDKSDETASSKFSSTSSENSLSFSPSAFAKLTVNDSNSSNRKASSSNLNNRNPLNVISNLTNHKASNLTNQRATPKFRLKRRSRSVLSKIKNEEEEKENCKSRRSLSDEFESSCSSESPKRVRTLEEEEPDVDKERHLDLHEMSTEFSDTLICAKCQQVSCLPTIYWENQENPFLCAICLKSELGHETCSKNKERNCEICSDFKAELSQRSLVEFNFLSGTLIVEETEVV